MADIGSSIFNKRATEKLRSPDDLDKYVRITNPSVWVVLGACFSLLVGLLVWGVFGTVATNVSCSGVKQEDGSIICLLTVDQISLVDEGDSASVNGTAMEVKTVSSRPSSQDEVRTLLDSDYLAQSLVPDGWAYIVTLEGDSDVDADVGIPTSVKITTEQVSPISLILKG